MDEPPDPGAPAPAPRRQDQLARVATRRPRGGDSGQGPSYGEDILELPRTTLARRPRLRSSLSVALGELANLGETHREHDLATRRASCDSPSRPHHRRPEVGHPDVGGGEAGGPAGRATGDSTSFGSSASPPGGSPRLTSNPSGTCTPRRAWAAETSCAICLEDIEVTLKAAAAPCMHAFCAHCLSRWLALEPSCPLCKREVRGIAEWRVGVAGEAGEGSSWTLSPLRVVGAGGAYASGTSALHARQAFLARSAGQPSPGPPRTPAPSESVLPRPELIHSSASLPASSPGGAAAGPVGGAGAGGPAGGLGPAPAPLFPAPGGSLEPPTEASVRPTAPWRRALRRFERLADSLLTPLSSSSLSSSSSSSSSSETEAEAEAGGPRAPTSPGRGRPEWLRVLRSETAAAVSLVEREDAPSACLPREPAMPGRSPDQVGDTAAMWARLTLGGRGGHPNPTSLPSRPPPASARGREALAGRTSGGRPSLEANRLARRSAPDPTLLATGWHRYARSPRLSRGHARSTLTGARGDDRGRGVLADARGADRGRGVLRRCAVCGAERGADSGAGFDRRALRRRDGPEAILCRTCAAARRGLPLRNLSDLDPGDTLMAS